MLSPPGLPHAVIDLKHPCILSSDSHPRYLNARLERELIVSPRLEQSVGPQDPHGTALQQDWRPGSTHPSRRRVLRPGMLRYALSGVVKHYGEES